MYTCTKNSIICCNIRAKGQCIRHFAAILFGNVYECMFTNIQQFSFKFQEREREREVLNHGRYLVATAVQEGLNTARDVFNRYKF